MKQRFDIQFFGGGSSTTTVPKRNPEPEELVDLRNKLYKAVLPGVDSYDPTDWQRAEERSQNAQKQQDALIGQQQGLLNRLPGALDRSNGILDEMLGFVRGDMANLANNRMMGAVDDISNYVKGDMTSTVKEMQDVVRNGTVPTALTDAANASVNKGLQSGMGSMLNNLAGRGVVNSSIASKGINGLAQNAADAMNTNYLNAFNSVLNGYNGVLSGQGNVLNGYNGVLNGLGNVQNAYNSMLGGYGQALSGAQGNANTLVNGAGALNSTINTLGQIPSQAYENAMASIMPGFNLWKNWQSSYDNREDYDTVVKQGK